MAILFPKLEILPDAQKELWPLLKEVPKNFVLYGGTAVALRYGHRQSVDFDFFSTKCDWNLLHEIPYLSFIERYNTGQPGFRKTNYGYQINYSLAMSSGSVKVSFIDHEKVIPGSIRPPHVTSDNKIQVASSEDLMGSKVRALMLRESAKDYLDISEMIERGVSLEKGFKIAIAFCRDTLKDDIITMNYFRQNLCDPQIIEKIILEDEETRSNPMFKEFMPKAIKNIPEAAEKINLPKILKNKLKLCKDLSRERGQEICR